MTIRGLSMLCSYTGLPISSTTMSPTSAYTHTHTIGNERYIWRFYSVVLAYLCLFVLVLVSRVLGHSKSSSLTPLPTPHSRCMFIHPRILHVGLYNPFHTHARTCCVLLLVYTCWWSTRFVHDCIHFARGEYGPDDLLRRKILQLSQGNYCHSLLWSFTLSFLGLEFVCTRFCALIVPLAFVIFHFFLSWS